MKLVVACESNFPLTLPSVSFNDFSVEKQERTAVCTHGLGQRFLISVPQLTAVPQEF